IEMRSCLAGGKILLVCAVIEKCAKKLSRLRAARSGAIRAANFRVREGTEHGRNCQVIELEELFPSALPIANIGFVPNLPEPSSYFGLAVSLLQMPRELINKLRPLFVVLRRIRPTGIDSGDGDVRKSMPIGTRVTRERFRHETNFDQRLY